MKRTNLAFVVGALFAGALAAQAQSTEQTPAPAAPSQPTPPPAPPSLTFTLTPTYASQYMFRGQRLGGQSFQPSLEADYGSTWDLGVWSSVPIDGHEARKVPGQSDPEIDPYGSYTFALNQNWSVQPGFTWYTYPAAKTNNGFYRETFEPNVALNYSFEALKLTPKFYYDAVLKEETYEFSAIYALPLKDLGTEVDFTGTAGTYYGTDTVDHSSSRVKAWGNYWLVGAAVPFQINKNSKLTIGWDYARGEDAYLKQAGFRKAANTAAVGRGVFTASYAWTF